MQICSVFDSGYLDYVVQHEPQISVIDIPYIFVVLTFIRVFSGLSERHGVLRMISSISGEYLLKGKKWACINSMKSVSSLTLYTLLKTYNTSVSARRALEIVSAYSQQYSQIPHSSRTHYFLQGH